MMAKPRIRRPPDRRHNSALSRGGSCSRPVSRPCQRSTNCATRRSEAIDSTSRGRSGSTARRPPASHLHGAFEDAQALPPTRLLHGVINRTSVGPAKRTVLHVQFASREPIMRNAMVKYLIWGTPRELALRLRHGRTSAPHRLEVNPQIRSAAADASSRPPAPKARPEVRPVVDTTTDLRPGKRYS